MSIVSRFSDSKEERVPLDYREVIVFFKAVDEDQTLWNTTWKTDTNLEYYSSKTQKEVCPMTISIQFSNPADFIPDSISLNKSKFWQSKSAYNIENLFDIKNSQYNKKLPALFMPNLYKMRPKISFVSMECEFMTDSKLIENTQYFEFRSWTDIVCSITAVLFSLTILVFQCFMKKDAEFIKCLNFYGLFL